MAAAAAVTVRQSYIPQGLPSIPSSGIPDNLRTYMQAFYKSEGRIITSLNEFRREANSSEDFSVSDIPDFNKNDVNSDDLDDPLQRATTITIIIENLPKYGHLAAAQKLLQYGKIHNIWPSWADNEETEAQIHKIFCKAVSACDTTPSSSALSKDMPEKKEVKEERKEAKRNQPENRNTQPLLNVRKNIYFR